MGPDAADQHETSERLCPVGRDVTLCYEAFGDPADPTVLLVAGLGQQLVSWPEPLCEALVARGLHVVRFDNRDVGRSSRATSRAPTAPQMLLRRFPLGQYDLSDLAADAAGLIAALGLGPAHVVGMSMGGMIGQVLAAEHPHRVRSLVSIMSTTGARRTGRPAPSTMRLLLAKPVAEREAAIARTVRMFRHIGSHGFPFDEAAVRDVAARAFDRGHDPAGVARQLAAIVKSGDRTAALRAITAPTLVVHGDRDRMVHPSGARATARAIGGARLETIEGMGHDLPAALLPRLAGLVADHVAVAERGGSAKEGAPA
ncbi:MAG TPA: alpha/beta hydrolase [Baekduia sp.]|nr:alpha/beta hydrolase [Baekduia sp.]